MLKTFCAIATIALGCGAAMAAEPIITTVVGGGTPASGVGDGGPATQALLENPLDVAVDKNGNLYIADSCRIRKVTPAGTITTIGGNGMNLTPPANGAPATSGSMCSRTVAVDPFGNVWFEHQLRIGKIDAAGKVTYVVGTGYEGFLGDGGPATQARIYRPEDIAFDAIGNAYIAVGNRIRKVGTNGIINTVAGVGHVALSGYGARDDGPALLAEIDPTDLFIDAAGNIVFVDNYYAAVRKVGTNGIVTRLSGGWQQFRSDPMAFPTNAYYPSGVVGDAKGNLFVSNRVNFVSMITPQGAIKHVVGVFNDTPWTGGEVDWGASPGFEGDGGPASVAKVRELQSIAIDAQGSLYILDAGNYRIRKITGTFAQPTVPSGAGQLTDATSWRLESQDQMTIGIAKGYANNDSRLDLFLLAGSWDPSSPYPGDYALYVYLQNADGTLAAPKAIALPHIEWNDIVATDLNHDRYTDIVISGLDYTDTDAVAGLHVFRGGPNGLSLPLHYGGIAGAYRVGALRAADMNHDGNMDVLATVATGGSGGIANWAVYYGNGTGAFTRKKLTPAPNVHDVLIRDFNADDRPDMLWGWATRYDSGIAIAYNDGVDSFLPPTLYPGTGNPDTVGFSPVIGDIDSDGQDDLLFSLGGNAPDSKVLQWTRQPDGTFGFVRGWGTYDIAETLIVEDMNGDRRDDLLVLHSGWDSVGYAQQTRLPNGRYDLDREVKAYARSGNQATPHNMAVGDFNNDGCKDVAITATNAGLQLQYGTRCIRAMHGSKPLLWPFHGGATSSGLQAPASMPVTTVNANNLWVAAQKVARATWRSTIGSWSNTTRALVAAGFAFAFFAWWLLPAAGATWGRRTTR
ncbi:FG-GAP-like repeat-containing protein [Lysobacter sp. 2RAF19]